MSTVIKAGSDAWIDVSNSFFTIAENYSIVNIYESGGAEDSVVSEL